MWGVLGLALGLLLLAKLCAKRRGGRTGCKVVGFLHPDLGIGGAERLVIDAAVGLQKSGREVVMYTAHHNPSHCFAETRDGTLRVVTAGSWLPRHVFGKGHVLFATLRMLWLTLYCIYATPMTAVDAYIVDQVSLPLLLLRWLTDVPTLFYCHFPDKLCDPTLLAQARAQQQKHNGSADGPDAHLAPYKLAQDNRGFLRRAYRFVFDYVEEACLTQAARVVFNSAFTKGVTCATFPSVAAAGDRSDVLYPPLNTNGLAARPAGDDSPRLAALGLATKRVVLSINRFEHQKNLPLAVEAFYEAWRRRGGAGEDMVLVMSGGYDARLVNQVQCLDELKQLAARRRAELTKDGVAPPEVVFLTSFTEREKYDLLHSARCLLYTPTGEHFGIVPLEAMFCGVPVVAVNSAGPLESVAHRKTGYLEPAEKDRFADAIAELLSDDATHRAMAAAAPEHVQRNFSHHAFTTSLVQHLTTIAA